MLRPTRLAVGLVHEYCMTPSRPVLEGFRAAAPQELQPRSRGSLLLASLERIAEVPIERVIVPHCETPVFVDGAARIRAAVAEARQN